MAYIARHYIDTECGFISPGEMFEADFTPEQEKRLMRIGAIERTQCKKTAEEETGETVQTNEAEMGMTDAEDAIERDEETPCEEQGVPVIDVMDGISAPTEEPKTGKRRKSK